MHRIELVEAPSKMVVEAGWNRPVDITERVFMDCVYWPPGESRPHVTQETRWWELLYATANQVRRSTDTVITLELLAYGGSDRMHRLRSFLLGISVAKRTTIGLIWEMLPEGSSRGIFRS